MNSLKIFAPLSFLNQQQNLKLKLHSFESHKDEIFQIH
jgi:hypothetical protein